MCIRDRYNTSYQHIPQSVSSYPIIRIIIYHTPYHHIPYSVSSYTILRIIISHTPYHHITYSVSSYTPYHRISYSVLSYTILRIWPIQNLAKHFAYHNTSSDWTFRMYCAAGKWHSLVFGILWHKESEGWLKVWFDKEVVLNKQNLQTILDVDDLSLIHISEPTRPY